MAITERRRSFIAAEGGCCQSGHAEGGAQARTIQHRNPQALLPQVTPLGIPGPTSHADHPLQWWGARLAQPLPALPFDGSESLQQGLEVTGIADRSRFQQRLQGWVVHGKAFPAGR